MTNKEDDQYRDKLTPEEYRITREKGTERAFTGEYWQCDGKQGMYHCKCCGKPLFDAETKYDSGSGWPSFYAPADESNVVEETDIALGMKRTEILCSHCQAHLGHVFPDGPQPTGLRYCVNSASLDFKDKSDK